MSYYYITPSIYDLQHHGILGQKWGVRRFQTADGSLTPEGRKRYGSNHASRRTERKEEKIKAEKKKQQSAQLEAARKAKQEKAEFQKNREKILKEGTATEVLKYRNEYTTQELQAALNRIKVTDELGNYSKKEAETLVKQIDKVFSGVKKANDWTNTSVNAYKNVKNVQAILKELSSNKHGVEQAKNKG